MADARTTVTELITGLGTLGEESLEQQLVDEPKEMVSVSPEGWSRLRELHRGGGLAAEFEGAWRNGQAFFRSSDALRGRRPLTIEWKGAVRAGGDEVVPADLRIDHVYLVSCKYLSQIVLNASPSYVFDRAITGGHGRRSGDWYAEIAAPELQALYEAVLPSLPEGLPRAQVELTTAQRRLVADALKGRWSGAARAAARLFSEVVAERSAARWMASLDTAPAQERLLLRLLRIGSAPYFVLGADKTKNLRLRIETPWDWRQNHRLVAFTATPVPSDQPVVGWNAVVEDRRSRHRCEVAGHVEVRWAHGKFGGSPEAKVYLDTPHHLVPGYVPLT